jgi:transcriptional regulator with XRE-family HTH domain
MKNLDFGKHLLTARVRSGLSQRQLASATTFHQSDISQMEQGKRLPNLEQVLNLARVLGVPMQWFLTGSNRVTGAELPDLAMQLRDLGIVDLHVENTCVPGAFREDEEAMVLAISGNAPPARIIEAMPAVLAWNAKNPETLTMFANRHDDRIKYRLGWLGDIAITIHQNQGFPGGCPGFSHLESYIRQVGLPEQEDWLGYARDADQRPPVSLRWKMGYPAPLASFRDRAERLHTLRAERLFRIMSMRW